jgi:probable HAF family extracellular repeat protein
MRKSVSFLMAAGAAILGANAQAAVLYSLSDLGAGTAHAINAAGQVAGDAQTQDGARAFRYSNGAVSNFGTLGGQDSFGRGILDSGVVIGSSTLANGLVHGFQSAGGSSNSITDLCTASLCERSFSATDGNDDFFKSISAASAPGQNEAGYLFSNYVRIGTEPGAAIAINRNNVIAGVLGGQAFFSDLAGGPILRIGTLGGATSFADDLNDMSAIVGRSDIADGSQRAFVYSNGVMTNLGALGTSGLGATFSAALGINNLGLIVGESTYAGSDFNDTHAVLWQNGVATDLNSLIDPAAGFVLAGAHGINDNGQIVGYGYLASDILRVNRRAFLLSPQVAAAVPAPASWALLIAGFGMVGAGMRRSRHTAARPSAIG